MTISNGKLNAVEKALKIIITLAEHEEGLGTSGLSEKLGFTMPTVSRLLNDLSRYDFVRKGPGSRNYVLGKSILDIGKFAYRHIGFQLVPIAKPYIDALRDTTEENATLEVLDGDNAVLVYRANTPHLVRIFLKAGSMVPAHVSPGAKAILAFSDPDVVDTTLKKKLPGYTPKTITDLEELKSHFDEIRRKKIAFDNGEYDIDINALGAPIFDRDNKPIAAVSCTFPRYRMKHHKKSKLVALVIETADKITDQIANYDI